MDVGNKFSSILFYSILFYSILFHSILFYSIDFLVCGQVEPPDRKWQYLLFAAEPYETIAFKVSFFNKISAVFRTRIQKLLGLPGPDPIVRGMDPNPDPPIMKQK
jgi:hypothetical protein